MSTAMANVFLVLAGNNASTGGPNAGTNTSAAAMQQAGTVLTWLVSELQALPPDAREEALRLPVQLVAKVTSRVAARTLRAIVGGTSSAGDVIERAVGAAEGAAAGTAVPGAAIGSSGGSGSGVGAVGGSSGAGVGAAASKVQDTLANSSIV